MAKTQARSTVRRARRGTVQRAKGYLEGVSARDVAVVGGVAGAIILGYVIVQNLTSSRLKTLVDQYGTVFGQCLGQLDEFIKANGTGALTPSQRAAVDFCNQQLRDIEDAARLEAILEQLPWVVAAVGITAAIALVIYRRYGTAGVKSFTDKVNSDGTPQTTPAYIQVMEGSLAVGLASLGNVTLATSFYNVTMATDNLAALASLGLRQAFLQAELSNLTGVQLAEAQAELVSITADIALVPLIFGDVVPLL